MPLNKGSEVEHPLQMRLSFFIKIHAALHCSLHKWFVYPSNVTIYPVLRADWSTTLRPRSRVPFFRQSPWNCDGKLEAGLPRLGDENNCVQNINS